MKAKLNTVKVGDKTLTPSKIICIGRNYVDHINELHNEIPNEMVVFLKPNSAISDELYSFKQEQLHYEGEICFVFEKGRFSAVGFGLDITKRELQGKLKTKELPWERAKAFDGSAVFGPFFDISAIDDSLSIELNINGQNIQSGNISLMMYKPQDILLELQTFMTLNDGDIIMTGTPKGVGTINKGDIFEGIIKTAQGLISATQWRAL
ncbi:MAG: fumarylacetoacetate hydrolase family protein [Thiotrichaceae bacterium]|nr:fumarylacetoacetate hydrolase family protein [Thiotrichaceae bacterium]